MDPFSIHLPLVPFQGFTSGFSAEVRSACQSHPRHVPICVPGPQALPGPRSQCSRGWGVSSASSQETVRLSPVKNHLQCLEKQKIIIRPTNLNPATSFRAQAEKETRPRISVHLMQGIKCTFNAQVVNELKSQTGMVGNPETNHSWSPTPSPQEGC